MAWSCSPHGDVRDREGEWRTTRQRVVGDRYSRLGRGIGGDFYARLPWRLAKPRQEPRRPGATSIRGWMFHDALEGNPPPGSEQLLPSSARIPEGNIVDFKQRCGAEALSTTRRETTASMLSLPPWELSPGAAFSGGRESIRQVDPRDSTAMSRRCWAFCDIVVLHSLAGAP
jgi:hypothetical protein